MCAFVLGINDNQQIMDVYPFIRNLKVWNCTTCAYKSAWNIASKIFCCTIFSK